MDKNYYYSLYLIMKLNCKVLYCYKFKDNDLKIRLRLSKSVGVTPDCFDKE